MNRYILKQNRCRTGKQMNFYALHKEGKLIPGGIE